MYVSPFNLTPCAFISSKSFVTCRKNESIHEHKEHKSGSSISKVMKEAQLAT
jgi:hypothetical protein